MFWTDDHEVCTIDFTVFFLRSFDVCICIQYYGNTDLDLDPVQFVKETKV